MTEIQMKVLGTFEADQLISQDQIAAILKSHPTQVTGVLNSLMNLGYIDTPEGTLYMMTDRGQIAFNSEVERDY